MWVSITTQIFLDFFNAPQILYYPPRLLLLGPENFSLHYTFKVYVVLEPYGLLFQKFVFFQAMPKSAMQFERRFQDHTVKALDNLRGYVALKSRVRASIGSPYMDRELRDLIEEARRIQAAECHSVACLESEARAELCLHMEVGYKRLGLLHKALNAKACDAWGRMTALQAEAFDARDRVAAEEAMERNGLQKAWRGQYYAVWKIVTRVPCVTLAPPPHLTLTLFFPCSSTARWNLQSG